LPHEGEDNREEIPAHRKLAATVGRLEGAPEEVQEAKTFDKHAPERILGKDQDDAA
jgi:hypothetical protein